MRPESDSSGIEYRQRETFDGIATAEGERNAPAKRLFGHPQVKHAAGTNWYTDIELKCRMCGHSPVCCVIVEKETSPQPCIVATPVQTKVH